MPLRNNLFKWSEGDHVTDTAPATMHAEERNHTEIGNNENLDEETGSVAVVEHEVDGSEKRNSFELALDIASSICLLFTSILFIAGCTYFHPDTWLRLNFIRNNMGTVFAVGAFFYMVSLSIDIYKRRSKGRLVEMREIMMTSLAVIGAFLWFIASFRKFFSTWLVGTIFVLASVTYDLVILIKRGNWKTFTFTTLAMISAWLANLLFLGGACVYLDVYSFRDIYSYAGLYISGSIFFFLYAIFHAMAAYTSYKKSSSNHTDSRVQRPTTISVKSSE